ncbi:SDR family NAD(P)-dependent oxidoreductase [Isoptericola sp. NPDC057559]|uniref:SDR family NAD(P)-dependent oxidoreductase n=1 Tax=Isoptericola sp. NPDC057559 TaxID=3346168 RepID=UPI0036BC31BC
MTDPTPTRAPLAIVTGGAAGIGRQLAERLAAEGHRVVCPDVAQHDLPALGDGPVPTAAGLVWTSLDVTDPEAVRATFDDLAARFGGIDVLVNNAGIQRHRGLEDLTFAEWSAVVDVNLHGVFSCLQAAGRHMLAAGRGAVVNISSVSSRGSAGRAPYATTKAAVVALTATAGAEWAARGVRVNAVAPGYIDTGVFRQGVAAGTLSEETILARIPAGRLADASEVANAVAFLASDQASYVVGQTLYVDGGFMVDYGVPLAKKPE